MVGHNRLRLFCFLENMTNIGPVEPILQAIFGRNAMEPAITNILLPTDFSLRSAVAARYAAVIARRFHSKLALLHVLPPLNVALESLGGVSVEEVLTRQKEQVEAKLAAFLVEELKEFVVTRVIAEGDPAQTIIEYAGSHKTDMIVCETRGTGMFRRFILGSVTSKVLHDAPCPVWTGVHAEQADVDDHWTVHHILCAVDPASGDESAVRWAISLASAFEARLSMVHAIPAPPFHLQTYSIESELRRLLSQGERERIVKMLEAEKAPPDTEIYVQSGPISKVVLTCAQDYEADLVVIGHGSENGVPGRLHTNGYAIIRDSICPVLSI
jgi:nucleotide-binding universal stress UspA family protein